MEKKYRVSILIEKDKGNSIEIVKEHNIFFDDYKHSQSLFVLLVNLVQTSEKAEEIKNEQEKKQSSLFNKLEGSKGK